MTIGRREFLAQGSLTALLALTGCGGGSGTGDVTVVPGGTTLAAAPPPIPTPTPSVSPTRLVLWGDSRTEGIGAVGAETFPAQVAHALPTLPVVNAGRSGQNAAQIVARQGGAPALLTIVANTIPASGSIAVVRTSANIFAYAYDPTAPGDHPGTLAGVAGVYSSDGIGGTTFTRTTAGNPVSCPAGTPFLLDQAIAERASIMFLCAGRNGIELEDPAATVALTARAVDSLTNLRRHIVAGIMPDRDVRIGTPERAVYDRLNAALQSRHGAAYLDLATPPTEAEMLAVGFTPTLADRAEIAVGVYPAAMFQDATHLLRSGQAIWSARVIARISARGWA